MKDFRREKDSFYWEAKKRGLRSRAYFKIEEIDRIFRIFSPGNIVIDIGAAPGGWLQYISNIVGYDGIVIGVDVKTIEEFSDKTNIFTIRGDIFENHTIENIKNILRDRKADVIVSDASPNITGVYELDTYRIYELNKRVLDIARKILKKNGILVLKTFQGREEKNLRKILKKYFRFIKIYKPKASRKRSSEIYYICFFFEPNVLKTSKTRE